MENLAGRADADRIIRGELTRCGIEIVEDPKQLSHPEVKVSATGRLGSFTFHRQWYYYAVSGRMPLATAKRLYEHPVGRTDIRVAGHCGCPAPEDPWLTWIAPDGKRLMRNIDPQSERELLKYHPRFYAKWLETHRLSDDPAAEGEAFVDCYHVDSELGLYLLAEAVRSLSVEEKA